MENLNLNLGTQPLKECLKSINNFGETTYVNICNGTKTVVEWGSVDWASNILFAGVIVMFIILLFKVFKN